MTLTYARIADRTVADEYAAVTAQIDALYSADQPAAARRRRRRNDAPTPPEHRRMLGNGSAPAPPSSTASFETVCETCGYFETGPEFMPVILRQRDHARRPRPTRPRRPLRPAPRTHRGNDNEAPPAYPGEPH